MTEVLGWETPSGQQPTLLLGVLGSALPQGILEGLWGICLIPTLIPTFGEESVFIDGRRSTLSTTGVLKEPEQVLEGLGF